MAARVGARPPLAEALRQVRSALASTYGISPEALECRPLEAALTRALQVPGATPESVSTAMLARRRPGVREMESADDPIAVLVWAADAAAPAVGASEPGAEENHRRLGLLDAALARQRQGPGQDRSGRPVAQSAGPPAGQRWRPGRLAAGRRPVLDYRDAAGIFDRDRDEPDPWRRAMVLAELGRHVPVVASRPPADVEALAQSPLRQLRHELDALARHRDTAIRRAASLRSTERELERARQALRPRRRAPAGPKAGPPPQRQAVQAQARARAEQRVVEAGRRWNAAVDGAGQVPARLPARMSLVSEAVAVREARLRAGVLTDPPAWVRHDLRRRVDGSRSLAPPVVEALARTYGDVAVFADRWGSDAGAASVDALLGERPPSPEATQSWLRLRSPGVVVERGVDLGL